MSLKKNSKIYSRNIDVFNSDLQEKTIAAPHCGCFVWVALGEIKFKRYAQIELE